MEIPSGSESMASLHEEIVGTWEIHPLPFQGERCAQAVEKQGTPACGLEVGWFVVAMKRVTTVEQRNLEESFIKGTHLETQEDTNEC